MSYVSASSQAVAYIVIAVGSQTGAFVSALVLVGVLSGCLDDNAVVCADGATICASFQVCAPGDGGCLFPEQITACQSDDGENLADGTACTSPGGAGQCDHGICSNGTCGNGIVEIGEV